MNQTQALPHDISPQLSSDTAGAALTPDPPVLPGKAARCRRVLVVDDHPLLRLALIDALIGQGYECYGAEHGLAALSLLSTTPVDLVVTDLSMPQMGGMELLVRMGMSPATQSIPVVVVTADLSDELWLRLLSAGAKAVVARSVRPDDVLSAVRAVVLDTAPAAKTIRTQSL